MLEDWFSLFRLAVSHCLLMPKVRQFPVGAAVQVVLEQVNQTAGKFWQKRPGQGERRREGGTNEWRGTQCCGLEG